MSNITPDEPRRLRIVGRPDNIHGFSVSVHDADTGEMIENICKLVITLDAVAINKVEVTYYPDKSDKEAITTREKPEVTGILAQVEGHHEQPTSR